MKHYITSDIHFGHANIVGYQPNSRGYMMNISDVPESLYIKIIDSFGSDDPTASEVMLDPMKMLSRIKSMRTDPEAKQFISDLTSRMNRELIDKFNSRVTEDDHTYILGDIGFCKPEQTMEFLKEMNGRKTIIHGNHDRELTASSIFQNPEQRRLAGIIEDTPYKVVTHVVDGVKHGIVLFHFRIASWDGAHHGSIHFYGHEHGGGPVQETRCMDIGVDTNNMNPYLLDSAVRLVCKRSKVVSGHHDGSR